MEIFFCRHRKKPKITWMNPPIKQMWFLTRHFYDMSNMMSRNEGV
ncbi:hypothetical protein [Prevotella sp. AM42-24]|nr:hypothetical protein [Prevotella sp. AM42-24]